jgi:hypothetical protein
MHYRWSYVRKGLYSPIRIAFCLPVNPDQVGCNARLRSSSDLLTLITSDRNDKR